MYWKTFFLYFSSITYVVGTQKNRINETVLLRTKKTNVKIDGQETMYNFTLMKFPYLDLCQALFDIHRVSSFLHKLF